MKNKTNKNITEEEIIDYSLGMLYDSEKDSFKSSFAFADNKVKKSLREFNNLTSLFSLALSSEKSGTPSDSVKDKLFEKLNLSDKSSQENKAKDFQFIFTNTGDWMPHPELKGIEVKPLSLNKEKGYLMLLMKAAAGSEYPSHHHSGAEECYVLEGDLFVEGKHLGPGDFHHAEGGSDHKPIRTKNGVTLLLVVDPSDY